MYIGVFHDRIFLHRICDSKILEGIFYVNHLGLEKYYKFLIYIFFNL